MTFIGAAIVSGVQGGEATWDRKSKMRVSLSEAVTRAFERRQWGVQAQWAGAGSPTLGGRCNVATYW